VRVVGLDAHKEVLRITLEAQHLVSM
jgi:hypothetical protein